MDTLKSQVQKAFQAVEGLNASLAATKEECARKPENKLEKVNALLAQVEEKVKGLDAGALQKLQDGLTQSLEDGSEKTAQRIDELSARLQAFNADLEAARNQLEEARNLLSNIRDKAGAVVTRPSKADTKPESEPEQKQDSRVF